jgi:hypothetical protein
MKFIEVPIELNTCFLEGKMKLYFLVKIHDKKQIQYVFYLGDRLLTYEEYNEQSHKLPGFIESVISIEEQAVIVLYINTTIHGKGVGMLLMCASILTANGVGITKIHLDDNSDRFRQKDNIYVKLHLKYNENYGPEMTGNTGIVVKIWKALVKKYGYFSHELSDEVVSIFGNFLSANNTL